MKSWEYENTCTFLYALYTTAYVPLPNFSVKTKPESFGTMTATLFAVDGLPEVGRDISLSFFYLLFVKIKLHNIRLFVNIWNYGRDTTRCSCILKKKITLKIEFKLTCLSLLLCQWIDFINNQFVIKEKKYSIYENQRLQFLASVLKWRYSFSGNQGKLFTKETGHLPLGDTMARLFIDTMM